MTTPSIRALRTSFPQAALTYLVEEPYRELVEGIPDLDDVIVLPRRLTVRDFLGRMGALRRRGAFDILIDFHGGPRAFWITLFSKARLKIGHRLKFKHMFYDIALPRNPGTEGGHSVEDHFSLVRAAGVEAADIPRTHIAPALPEEKARVDRLLDTSLPGNRRIIVLHVGAGNRFRDWGRDNLKELVARILELPRTAVALIGGAEDSVTSRFLTSPPSELICDLTGRLNLREVRDLITRAALFVGPDSGPMHIASTTDTPIVAYFGPTLPAHFAPWKAQALLLENEQECRPCRQRECPQGDIRCLQDITPEDVFQAVKRVIQPGSAAGLSD
jgi:heptosyltransferase-1